MKKHLTAAALMACLTLPAFAANKFVAASPEEPLHRRAIVLCVVVLVALQAWKHRPALPPAGMNQP